MFESHFENIIWSNRFRSWQRCIKSNVDSFVEWLMIEWKFDFFLNRCTSELRNVIFHMFFLCFHFWFHLQNVRWICECLMTHRFRQRVRKFFFLINRWFFFVLTRWIETDFRLKNLFNHQILCDSWKKSVLNQWWNWFAWKNFLICFDRV